MPRHTHPLIQVLASKLAEAEDLALESVAMARANGVEVDEANPNIGLVVEGGALALCLHPEHQDAFMALCSACKSVVCCRVSPMQKAQVTKLVQVGVLGACWRGA